MLGASELTTVETVHDDGSYTCTVRDSYGERDEVIVVPCEDDPGVRAWINRCTHEAQRFDTGRGAPMRDGQVICPKHGSLFDACSGECDNGEAAGTTLPAVDLAVEEGTVFLRDDDYTFVHDGTIDDDDGDDGPSSTSHIGF
ncbi:Rieske (2Fe-2S) protein [Halomicrobium katesii]|uniref:Rieske (2Fe-2S) protein n=1 Tax=Halomicrobium katesii TaxID=437163 RepID=UPI00037DE377|nr:Rieske 2Fe-2S domain-containing protein [Halomicrobium katesii]